MRQEPVPGPNRATDRGLALVRVVGEHPDGLSLAEAARAVDLPVSTTLRQLRSLEAAGFAQRSNDSRYRPGPELLRIARLLSVASLPQRAQPVLAVLAEETGESTYLAEPMDADRAVYSAMAPGRHAVRHVSWLGQPIQREGTAVGAALDGEVDRHGAVSIRDAVEEGVTAVSAPIRDSSGTVIGALSIVGPSFRLRGALLARVRVTVARHAELLSDAEETQPCDPSPAGSLQRVHEAAS